MSGSEHSIDIQAPDSRNRQLAQGVWLILALISFGILILVIPEYLFSPSLGVLEDQLILEPDTPAFLLTRAVNVASFLSAVCSIGLALFLFLKKRTDPMGLFLSYYLLGHGILFAGPIEMLQSYWPAAPWVNSFILLPLFAGPMTIALVAIFPDGRFVPHWSRWLIPISFVAMLVYILSEDAYLPIEFSLGQQSNIILILGLVAASLGLSAASIYVQVYRYRFVSTPEQRFQTKWVLYGLGLWLIINLITSAGWNAGLQMPAGTTIPTWLPLASLLWVGSSLILPITLTISITHFRLFEIDLIINRTLVYGILTAGVIAIYVVVVTTLGILFQTQGNMVVALFATAIVAVMFQPLRERLQRGVNRLIFGARDDPIEAFAQLGSLLETVLEPDQVLPTLVETIAQTLKLSYVAIVLPAGEEQEWVAAASGSPSPDPVRFPLAYRGECIGHLLVSLRSTGSSFSPAERRLLRNIARQAGVAVHAAQLTDDLRRSRQQIVTAREEERRRLRRDLHDGIGPAMAGQTLKLDAALDLISTVSENGEHEELTEATQLLLSLKAQTRESIKTIRRIVYGLRPPALDDLGLLPAIQAQVTQVTGPAKGLQVTVDTPPAGLPKLPAAVEVAVYRIVLEALTNVVQHAQAQNCRISIFTTTNPHPQINLKVVDDGVGPPPNLKSGVGLASMHERATELGGQLIISSQQPTGTRVSADIPFVAEVP